MGRDEFGLLTKDMITEGLVGLGWQRGYLPPCLEIIR